MIDIGPMESILNGAGIAEANAARTAAEDARAAAAAKAATVVTPAAMMNAEVTPAAEVATAPIQEKLTAEGQQALLRLAAIAGLGVLRPDQYARVMGRLDAAGSQIELPNGAGTGFHLAY